MTTRHAKATWTGTLKDGRGTMKTGSGKIEEEFSFCTRFEKSQGTNPEELIGAAHAGCFSMALAATLEKAGFKPEEVQTSASVDLEEKDGGFQISRVRLNTEARIPGMNAEEFKSQVENASRQCVISKALTGTEVEIEAQLAA